MIRRFLDWLLAPAPVAMPVDTRVIAFALGQCNDHGCPRCGGRMAIITYVYADGKLTSEHVGVSALLCIRDDCDRLAARHRPSLSPSVN